MNHKLKRALFFLRLTDENGLLSITHIACMVVLYKIATAADPNIAEMSSLLVALGAYGYKRHVSDKRSSLTEDASQRLEQMEQKVKEAVNQAQSISAHIGLGSIIKK